VSTGGLKVRLHVGVDTNVDDAVAASDVLATATSQQQKNDDMENETAEQLQRQQGNTGNDEVIKLAGRQEGKQVVGNQVVVVGRQAP